MNMPILYLRSSHQSVGNGSGLRSNFHQRGLTLIEIMIAMTISLVLLAGVVQIFTSSKAAYRVNEAQSRLQENGRFALQVMAKDIRLAGFWGCLGDSTQVTDNLYAGGSVNPTLGGINGTEGGVGIPAPPDTITVQGAVGGGLPVNSHSVPAATVGTSANNGLAQDDIFLMGDCTRADLLQIINANPNTSGSVVFNTGAGTPGNATGPTVAYGPNAVLYRANSVTYSIANGNSGQPSLFRNENGTNTELVEGVENLQIVYGVDTNDDGTANFYNNATTVGAANMSKVVSVRADLTLRSLTDNIASVVDPVANDRRLRNTFSSTIVLRNRLQ